MREQRLELVGCRPAITLLAASLKAHSLEGPSGVRHQLGAHIEAFYFSALAQHGANVGEINANGHAACAISDASAYEVVERGRPQVGNEDMIQAITEEGERSGLAAARRFRSFYVGEIAVNGIADQPPAGSGKLPSDASCNDLLSLGGSGDGIDFTGGRIWRSSRGHGVE